MAKLPPGVKGLECKHALYTTANDGSPNDLLVIKEYQHREDGSIVPHLRLLENFKRPFWVDYAAFEHDKRKRYHDKKEWQHKSKLREGTSTQVKLVSAVSRALGRAPVQGGIRMLARNPYVYGIDVTTPVLIKHKYMEECPNCVSDNLVAVVDAETDMGGLEEIIMLSITMRDKAKLIVVKDFLKGIHDPSTKIQAAFEKYLGEVKAARNITLEIEYAANAGECAAKLIQTAHEWQPDFLTFWNINFDFPKMIQVLEKYGYDLAEVMSDPRIPPKYRYFKYIQGPSQKVTASGKTMALHPAEQWHIVECPASWYAIDAMCVYLKLRIAKGKEPRYSLDYILNKHLGVRKLKFEEANHLHGGSWHKFMQDNYKVEYCIYNLFDCIGVEMLDEKTTDLRQMISSLCGHSEYHRFPSQPRRTCDDLHFFCLERDLVAATTSDQMKDELDEHVVDLEGWIVTLPSHLVFDDGIKAIAELPDVPTLARAHVADLDVEGTYPNVEVLCNISKETTAKELSKIEGIDETVQRAVGINLSGGYVNAVEICTSLYKAPSFDQLLSAFKEQVLPHSRARPAMSAALREELATGETRLMVAPEPKEETSRLDAAEVDVLTPEPVITPEMVSEVIEEPWW